MLWIVEVSMATITIRNVPDELVDRIKWLAGQKGVSMEQEIRDLLQNRYEQRGAVLKRIRQRWETLPLQSAEPMQDWKEQGRP
jgi:antitoxin FitA